MQLFLTDEQKLLKNAVRRFVERDKAIRAPSQLGHDQNVWSTFAEQGWLAAGVREELGGIGEGVVAVALIAEELGRGLIPEAYVPVAAVAAQLLTNLAPDHGLLNALMSGKSRPILAHFEAAGRGDETWVQTSAVKSGGGYVLTGTKAAVLGGPAA